MNQSNYIFLSTEGYTFQPGSDFAEPEVENAQVVGFAAGTSPREAFESLMRSESHLLELNFDEIICYRLAEDYEKNRQHFHVGDFKRLKKEDCCSS